MTIITKLQFEIKADRSIGLYIRNMPFKHIFFSVMINVFNPIIRVYY